MWSREQWGSPRTGAQVTGLGHKFLTRSLTLACRPRTAPTVATGTRNNVLGALVLPRRRHSDDAPRVNLVSGEALMVDGDPKRVVRRLIDETTNHGNLSLLEELYAPALAPAARRWIEPFLASFSDLHMRIVELVTENETVVGRFSCSGTHTDTWMGHQATGRRFTDLAEVYFFRVVDGRIIRA